MYFIENYSPIETYNHVHSMIIYDSQITPSQFLESNPDHDYFSIELSQGYVNQNTPTTIAAPGNFLSQVPETDTTQDPTLVRRNTLETEPAYPEQKPFKPQKLPLVLEKKKARPPSSPGITRIFWFSCASRSKISFR